METLDAALTGAKKIINEYRDKIIKKTQAKVEAIDKMKDASDLAKAIVDTDKINSRPEQQNLLTLSSLKNRLITNYDLTKFEFDVKDEEHKSYIDFICKRNLAYNAAKNNNIKDFIIRYKNVIAAIPSLAIAAIKQHYKMALLAKNEYFFDFTYKTLVQINSDNAYNQSGNLLPDNIRISMLENYLFNNYNLDPDSMSELNSMARLTNSLLLAVSSGTLTDKEAESINAIIAAVVSKNITKPTKAVIDGMIKQDPNISDETKNNIINNKIVIANIPKKSSSA